MTKVAVLMAEGYEEGETVTIVDVLRRANLECTTFGLETQWVKGLNGMRVKADRLFSKAEVEKYTMLVLPGGKRGAENMMAHSEVMDLIREWNEKNKLLAAICAGTTVLAQARVIEGKKVTGYTGYQNKLIGGIFVNEVVVADQNVITSQGPATPYPFAFKIAEVLGQKKEVEEMKERLMYTLAKGK